MRFKLLLFSIVILIGFSLYTWRFFNPLFSMNSIELGQHVTLKDGAYKFKFNDVNNGYELNNGVVSIKNGKINIFIAYKYYNSLWDKGIIECYKDLEKIPFRHDVSLLKQNDDIFEGFIGNKNSPFKIYAKGECKKSPDKEASMRLSFSQNKEDLFDESNVTSIDNKLIDKAKWFIPETEMHFNKVTDDSKHYSFLHYTLGEKFNHTSNPFIYNGIQFYYANPSGIEKIVDNFEYSSYVKPSKVYIELDEKKLIKGIYAIEKIDQILDFEECTNKLENYKKFLLSKHSMDWKTTEFYTGVEQKEKSRLYFIGLDKINNVNIEVKCQENKLYKGKYMTIKIQQN